jgi:hypothetical protein
MNHSILVLFAFMLMSCGTSKTTTAPSCFVDQFEEQQAAALREALAYWNEFLQENYPHLSDSVRTRAYFNDLEAHSFFVPSWTFQRKKVEMILASFEESGLRKELYIRADEMNGFDEWVSKQNRRLSPDSIDRAAEGAVWYFNESGRFKIALQRCSDYYPLFESYYLERRQSKSMSPAIVAFGLDKSFGDEDYKHPAMQSIIFFELFSWNMNEYLHRRSHASE